MPWRGGSRSAELIENRRRVCISGKTLPDRPRLPPWFATSGGQTMELSQKKVPGVAPRAGAWIETSLMVSPISAPISRSPCGSVDRNCRSRASCRSAHRRSPCGSVDRNCLWCLNKRRNCCRSPCGSVDRNWFTDARMSLVTGRSPCGSVDRNQPLQAADASGAGRSPCGSVDRNNAALPTTARVPCRSPCGSVDRNMPSRAPSCGPQASLPVRERGSKPAHGRGKARRGGVAPRAGAWIETVCGASTSEEIVVAPRAGAWIETSMSESPHKREIGESLPVRERGSKHGASGKRRRSLASLPVRERGSKLRPDPGPAA